MSHERGDAAVEYVILLGTIALPALAGFVVAGKAIVDTYTLFASVLAMPLP